MPERKPDSTAQALVRRPENELAERRSALEVISAIPEEEIWLAGLRSDQTRRAYRRDVAHFVETIGIRSFEELRQVTHKHVIAWRRHMSEVEGLQNSTVRRRLSALSSLFTHLVERDPEIQQNPARDVHRPNINRKEGSTPAFSPEQARAMLDTPDSETVAGLRDRAILSVGFQAGLRRAEIAHLTVRWKGLRRDNRTGRAKRRLGSAVVSSRMRDWSASIPKRGVKMENTSWRNGYLLTSVVIVVASLLAAGCPEVTTDEFIDEVGGTTGIPGACCTDSGCKGSVESLCLDDSGIFFSGQFCGSFSPCRGACCRNGECFVAGSKNECSGLGGDFKGAGTTCDIASICADPGTPDFADSDQVGICCLDVSCLAVPLDECTGTLFLASDNCTGIDCTKGACCDTLVGDCFETSFSACTISATGVFAGPGTTCADTNCNLGACCMADGSQCTDVTETECLAGNGAFKGIGTNCDRNQCLTAPCCQTDGSCVELFPEACRAAGGAALSADKSCSDLPCSTGLCCLLFPSDDPFGDCRDDFTQFGCEGQAGTFAGAGLTCTDNAFEAVTAISINDVSNMPETGTFSGQTSFTLNVTWSGNPAFPLRLEGFLDVAQCPSDASCPAVTRKVGFRVDQMPNHTITIADWNACPGFTTVSGVYAEPWRFRIVDQHCVTSNAVLLVVRCGP